MAKTNETLNKEKWIGWYQSDMIVKNGAFFVFILCIMGFISARNYWILIPVALQVFAIILTDSFSRYYKIKLKKMEVHNSPHA